MTVTEYRRIHQHDEILHLFPGTVREAQLDYSHGQTVWVPRRATGNLELHHICGSGNGSQRDDAITNVIKVQHLTHLWLEAHKVAGFVVCCYAKREKWELDWPELQRIKGKCLPDWLETDQVIECCAFLPWIEELRRELVDARD